MTDTPDGGSAPTSDAGSGDNNSTDGDNQPGEADQKPKDELVPKRVAEEFQRDMHKYKDRFKEAQQAAEQAKRELEAFKRKKLEEAEDYKQLWERSEAEKQAALEESERLKTNVLYSERYRAVLPILKREGLRDDALNLLDKESLEEIEISPTSNGRFHCSGMDDYARKFKSLYPYAFKGKSLNGVNGAGGGGGAPESKTMTARDVIAIEKQVKAGKKPRSDYDNAVKAWIDGGKQP